MQSTRRARRSGRRWTLAGALATSALLLVGCGTTGRPSATPPTSSGSVTARPSDSAAPDTQSPAISPSPGTPVDIPSLEATPTADLTAANPTATGTPGSTKAMVTCTTVTPVRVDMVTSQPRRTTEVISVVSDGKNITTGTGEQTDFLAPTLQGPDRTEITDEATITKIAALINGSGKNRVLLTRPEAPDADVNANRRPFNAPGTYVLYNASGVLDAEVIVQCNGQQQRWSFTAEADNTTGQVNCAVEPPKTNAIARSVFASNC